jgi:Zn-dependent peptidase ImmA (M78 family)/transcriptional regulator with XRE-family HTH domain
MAFKDQLGARIREARKRLDLSQEELARAAEFPHLQTISDIERGTRDIKAFELARLARALRVSVIELLGDGLPETPAVLWRNPPQRPSATEAKFIEKCRQYRWLEEVTGQVRPVHLPELEVDPRALTHRQAAGLGEQMGQSLALGTRPASSLLPVLEEDYGVKIWYEDLGRDGSASCVKGAFGPAILINAREPRWRRNFSVAHEIFHLLTWSIFPPEALRDDDPLRARVEALANTFASALLLPGDTVRTDVETRVKDGRVSVNELIDVARQYDVSTDALLWRLVNLDRLNKDEVQKLLGDSRIQELDAERRREDRDAPLMPPARFVRLAHLAYTRGDIGWKRLADLLGVELGEVEEKLGRYGLVLEPSTMDAELTPASV